jgi:hypothetical protein
MKTSQSFPFDRENAIRRPSGEKTGMVSSLGVLVRRLAVPPARSTSQIFPAYVNAMCD